eukprot:TRINITY_DN22252_c0_g1_i1.p1 TRINITY_DN22252_c0_g1~~TRINITY_DN22252_c0_g1_i1.p1  ORF type:complete len:416 (+),score=70.45 TRINITY_DN22252_c0_g1_i1:570-1817(+)
MALLESVFNSWSSVQSAPFSKNSIAADLPSLSHCHLSSPLLNRPTMSGQLEQPFRYQYGVATLTRQTRTTSISVASLSSIGGRERDQNQLGKLHCWSFTRGYAYACGRRRMREVREARGSWVTVRASADESETRGALDASVEKSVAANEEILLFFYKLDLTTRLQKALNQEQYDPAKDLREKIAELDEELIRLREARMGASSKDEAQDAGLTILRIKTALQAAIEEERYAEAAELRDSLAKAEAEALAASLTGLSSSNVTYEFRLGQKVRHRQFSYRGVICGYDPVCCETEKWIETAQIAKLPRGRNQPFYQLLTDVRELNSFFVAYVAEDQLAPLLSKEEQQKPFNHPYTYLLFYGTDAQGDFIPTRELREKYNAARHELPYDEDESGDGGEGDGTGGGGGRGSEGGGGSTIIM